MKPWCLGEFMYRAPIFRNCARGHAAYMFYAKLMR